jgi:hypothetical protein
VTTSIHGDVKGLLFREKRSPTTVIPAKAGIQAVCANERVDAARYIPWIPAFAGMTKTRAQPWPAVMLRRSEPKTSPERQWPLVESRPHVCAPAPNHLCQNRLVFRCFLGDFFCTSKRSYSAAGPRPGAVLRGTIPLRQAANEHSEARQCAEISANQEPVPAGT